MATDFFAFDGRWVSLEFKDGRRLVGWPFRFSSSGQPRALLVADATWNFLDENRAYISHDVAGPGVYIGSFDEVVSMEFLDEERLMSSRDKQIAIDGRGIRPSSPKPLPTFAQPGQIVAGRRGENSKPTSPKPSPPPVATHGK